MQKSSYSKEDLLACAKGELFGPGNPQLPSGTLLMFDKVTCITEDGGLYGKGYANAELMINPNLWFFNIHFLGDPVMPGCLGLDAMWQLLGFFLGWRGGKGHGRALGMEKVSFTGQILPDTSLVTYEIHVKRIRWDRLAEANGITKADGKTVYQANNIRVGLFKQGETTI